MCIVNEEYISTINDLEINSSTHIVILIEVCAALLQSSPGIDAVI